MDVRPSGEPKKRECRHKVVLYICHSDQPHTTSDLFQIEAQFVLHSHRLGAQGG